MLEIIKTRISQGHRTARYPKVQPTLPDRFRGRPVINQDNIDAHTLETLPKLCATGALCSTASGGLTLDMGKCLFCGRCDVCNPSGKKAVTFSNDHRLAARSRDDLRISTTQNSVAPSRLDDERLRLFRRSLRLRQVSAGGCNACEADINVLNTLVFDLSRFGIQFVASPRHADGLIITGPVTKNMALALRKTFDATPAPKVVIAVGACAISGGMFAAHDQVHHGAEDLLPVDLFIPGCPPHPYTILDGLLRLLGRID